MNTKVSNLEIRTAVLIACLLLVGCDDDGPTAPTRTVLPTPTPTPTPAPIPNLAGTWKGVYRDFYPFDGYGPEYAAAATFTQDESRLSGTVTTQKSALREGTLQADLQRPWRLPVDLRGTLTLAPGQIRSVSGSASGSRMRLNVDTGSQPYGVIDLTR